MDTNTHTDTHILLILFLWRSLSTAGFGEKSRPDLTPLNGEETPLTLEQGIMLWEERGSEQQKNN